MKKFLQSTLLCAIVLLLAGCAEDVTVRNIKGAYRYKASGVVTVTTTSTNSAPTTRTHNLSETGVMEIVSLKDGDDVLLTFNQSGGSVFNTRGTASDEDLRFDSFTRTMQLDLETYNVEVSGKGEIYENTIILYLTMSGTSTSSDRTLEAKEIQMLAQKN
ncbi:MAG: hypothetical protein ACI30A_03700 [Paludibacteraceae bacterium]